MKLYDLPTGYGALVLYLLGGSSVVPAVGYMGGKRQLAPEIAEAQGLAPGLRLDGVVLADAGCPGWVWPELLTVRRADRVADVLQSWGGEDPVDLWQRLVKLPPAADPSERAAQVLWLQGRSAGNVPVFWSSERARWEMGDTPYTDGRPKVQATYINGHVVRRTKALKPKGFNAQGAGGLLATATVAVRIKRIAQVLSRHRVTFHAGDLFDVLDAGAGDYVYLDPDYVGCTSYGATVPRDRLLGGAEDLRSRGVHVTISERVPLPMPGWWHLNLTRPGKKPEWLTMSHPPRTQQARLWGAA